MTITLSGTPVIHTKRLILRAPEPWDAAPDGVPCGSPDAPWPGSEEGGWGCSDMV